MSDFAVQTLARYTTALNANPLRTKMLTSGFLAALAEVLATRFAGVPIASSSTDATSEKRAVQHHNKNPVQALFDLLGQLGLSKRVVQMFIYGFAISAPLGHVMTGILQRRFAGKTTTRDKITQIVTANLTTAVLSNTVYIFSLAYINGARSLDRIVAAWKANIGFLMRVTWVTSPISIGVAQKYLPASLWEPYFAFVRFILATVFNTITKKKQMALQRKQPNSTTDKDLKKGAAQGK